MSDQSLLTHLGYALLGLFYVAGGVYHFKHFSELSAALCTRRIPLPGVTLVLGSVFQIAAGLMLTLQVGVRFSAIGPPCQCDLRHLPLVN